MGINPAPTQQGDQIIVGTVFTPARIGSHSYKLLKSGEIQVLYWIGRFQPKLR